MLSQNLVQVYPNDDGDVVIVIGEFKSADKAVELESIVIPADDLSSVFIALKRIYDEFDADI
jgi:hypothetical protein